jgi:two-component system response regulator HupR/HoxA
VRELRNALERAVALCAGPEVSVEDLPPAVQAAEEGPAVAVVPSELREVEVPSTLAQSKQDVELRRIQEALHRHRNNRLRAAAELGISRMALYKKLHRYGLAHKAASGPSVAEEEGE